MFEGVVLNNLWEKDNLREKELDPPAWKGSASVFWGGHVCIVLGLSESAMVGFGASRHRG